MDAEKHKAKSSKYGESSSSRKRKPSRHMDSSDDRGHSSHKNRDYSKKSKSKKSKHSRQEDDERLLKKLVKKRKDQKEEDQKKKELMKAKETPEEKRLRRLMKKEAKERKRKEAMGWDKEFLHFTNDDNPYGDSNLLTPFIWHKKLEKDGLDSLTKEEVHKLNRSKMEENRYELVKVKKRRQEREKERAERENLMELEQRQKEAAQFSEFSKQEDVFQLEQARIRSHIRIQDGRAKPIDLLAQYVNSEGDVSAVDMHEPYRHLTGLTLNDLEDLIEDIKVYQQLDKQNENQTYWNDLTTIVFDELRRLRHRESDETTNQRQGVHASVADSISKLFHNRSVAELSKLQCQIETKLAGPTAGIDVGYWESLLSQLKAHQARANLRERHRENLRNKLEILKAEQGVQVAEEPPSRSDKQYPSSDSESEGDHSNEESAISASINSYQGGRFSPKMFAQDDLEPGTVVIDEREDGQRLMWARQKFTDKNQKADSSLTAEEKAMQREAQKAMTSDEVQFSVEAKIDSQHYLWSDKYRPRKPRYFNRVHTGFEWNKYNQTHYDMDNPPPKIVQGYKFNIFYPDLIDKGQTPQYELIPCGENKDFALLKFTAGPPYEDIAFKIVSREWEYSYKRGFRCQFHNNIFQLWFHFKRYRYRR